MDYLEGLLNRLSSERLLACQDCLAMPKWYKPGITWEDRDDMSAEIGIDVNCPLCGAFNSLSSHSHEYGGFTQWNGKTIDAP